jgi:hypothetical protein
MNSLNDEQRDHLRHLRSVHFWTVAISFALIVGSFVTGEALIERAYRDFRHILDLTKLWQENWLELEVEQMLQQNPCPASPFPMDVEIVGKSIGPAIVRLELTDRPKCGMVLYGEVTGLWRDSPPRIALDPARNWSAPRTLADFKNMWDWMERSGLTLYCPSYLGSRAHLFHELLKPGQAHITDLGDVRISMPESKSVTNAECTFYGGIHTTQSHIKYRLFGDEDIPLPWRFNIYLARANARKDECPEANTWVAGGPDRFSLLVEIECEHRTISSLQSCINKHYSMDFHLGWFKDSFPELEAVTSNYQDVTFPNILAILEGERTRAGEKLQLLGASIPSGWIAVFGIPLLLITQCYFFSHVRAWNQCWKGVCFPWVVLYEHSISRWLSSLSLLLPPATVLVLACTKLTGFVKSLFLIWLLSVTFVGISLALSYFSAKSLDLILLKNDEKS